MAKKTKLELTWIGKEDRPRLEPRVLVEDPTKSYHAAERVNEDDIRGLIDFDDISYDDHSEQLYKLAGQMVAHLKSYLADEDEVFNVLVSHNRQLVDAIYAQLQQHYYEEATSYEVKITKGFRTLRSTNVLAAADETVRPFRQPVEERLRSTRVGV